MSKKVYIGVPTEVPIKEYTSQSYILNMSNLAKFFSVSSESGNSAWSRTDATDGGLKLVPGNIGVNSSTATITLTAKQNLTGVVIKGAYYTESNYDKITLTVAGSTVLNAVSGTSALSQRWTGSLASGKTIVLKYTKDSSQHASSESSTYFQIDCDDVIETTEIITGYETKDVGRNVGKMYLGINGVARRVKKGYIGVKNFVPRSLPNGYTQVEYIESNGTQYIDTEFKHNQDTRVVMDVQVITQPGNHAWMFEGRTNGVSNKGLLLLNGTTWNADYVNGSSGRHPFSSIGVLDKLIIDYNKNNLVINGVSYTWTAETFQSTVNLVFFACNTDGTISGYITARLWSAKIYDNETLIRDYIPCINENGVCGLWDDINSNFYESAGSGSFVPGSTYKEVARLFFAPTLVSIAIKTNPTKTQYVEGESFDPSGMVVTATYDNNATFAIIGYDLDATVLSYGQNSVTISYTDSGITKTTTVAIQVISSVATGTYWLIDSNGINEYDSSGTVVSSSSTVPSTWTCPGSGDYTVELHATGGRGGSGYTYVFQQSGNSTSSNNYGISSSGSGGGGSGAIFTLSLTKNSSHTISITSSKTNFDSNYVNGGSNGKDGSNYSNSTGVKGGSYGSYSSGGTLLASSGSSGKYSYSDSASSVALTGGSGGSGGATIGNYGNGGNGSPTKASYGSGSLTYKNYTYGTSGAIIIRKL